MKLTRLAIRRLPGIDTPFELGPNELRASVHVVHGPNGVGKSSLVRAVRALLWPQSLPGQRVDVEASFVSGGTQWHASRDGARVAWQRDGRESPPPPLPSQDLAASFLVSIEDLSRTESHDFEHEIQRAMSGGVDFAALAERVRWSDHEARAKNSALTKAEEQLQSVLGELSELGAEAATIERLKVEREDAKLQLSEVQHYEQALALCNVRSELQALADAGASFPPGIDLLRGDEPDRLAALREAAGDREAEIAGLDRELSEARRMAQDSGLTEPMGEVENQELTLQLGRWKDAEREVEAAEVALASARARREAARAQVLPEADPSTELDATRLSGAKLETFLREAIEQRAARAALQAHLARLQKLTGGIDASAAQTATTALRSWLAAPEPARRPEAWPWLVLALLAALAFALLAWALHPLGSLGIAASALLAWRGLRARSRADMRLAFQQQYEALRLGPLDWERAAVEERLHTLEGELQRANAAREDDVRRRELERQLGDLAPREAELERRRAVLRTELGVDPALPDFDLALFARAYGELQDAEREVRGAEAALAQREAQRDAASDAVQELLATRGVQDAADVERAGAVIVALQQRSVKLGQALFREKQALSQREGAVQELGRSQAALAKFWADLGLQFDDESGLAVRLEMRGAWQKHRQQLQELQTEAARLERRLGERASDAALGAAELESRLRSAQQQSSRLEDLIAEISALEQRMRTAREGTQLELAAAAQATCERELERSLELARSKTLAQLLLSEVRSEYEREAQPEVVQRAGASLQRYTHGRYRLLAQPDGSLRALDGHQDGRGLELRELSTGTRAQLLLAVRLAFAAEAASGEVPPVFLDDAFATSDVGRIRAIGEALRESARGDGQQFFYLTTEAADAEAIAGGERAQVDVIDLAALRRAQLPSESRGKLALPELAPVPAPGSMKPEDYAALLRVPRIDARAGIDALHLFYVLRDELPVLHSALVHRIESVSALRAAQAAGSKLVDAATTARAEAWIAVSDAVLAAWRIGRGRPIDRAVLADAGVTDAFLDKLAALAGEVGHDARELMAALEAKQRSPHAKGFQDRKREELREYLEREGYLDAEPALDREQAWSRVLGLQLRGWKPEGEALRARFEWLWSLLEGKP